MIIYCCILTNFRHSDKRNINRGICLKGSERDCDKHNDCNGYGGKCCNGYCCSNKYFEEIQKIACVSDEGCQVSKYFLKKIIFFSVLRGFENYTICVIAISNTKNSNTCRTFLRETGVVSTYQDPLEAGRLGKVTGKKDVALIQEVLLSHHPKTFPEMGSKRLTSK